jgi:GNAT superfamily N-acetyltransferase
MATTRYPRYNRAMLEIRFAGVGDAATLLRFIQALAVYERAPDAVEVDAETLAAQLGAAQPPFECLLAEQQGVAVGFALFFHSYSTWRGRRGIWLEDLFVSPEARRRGVGRALLERVMALARERGCGRLEWSVLDWNQPALDFYRSLGADVLDQWRICRISM